MVESGPQFAPEAGELLCRARAGSSSAVGELLEGFRAYLQVVAAEELADALRPKVGPSDLVQETFLEAHRDFQQFRGSSPDELKAWLRRILLNNVANLHRRYLQTAKRQLVRERLSSELPSGWNWDQLFDTEGESPSGQVMRNEQAERLEAILRRLPKEYCRVLKLRHQQQLGFTEIGRRLKRSPDAARMLWWRAFERLAEHLEREHETC